MKQVSKRFYSGTVVVRRRDGINFNVEKKRQKEVP